MTISRKDWLFIIGALIVVGIFFAISGEEKTKKMPKNETHRKFYDMLQKEGKSKKEVDPLCAECHDGVKIPFPPNHPEKPGGAPMRCLFCHKIIQ